MTLKYDFKDKRSNIDTLNNYMLMRTLAMFDWSGLPDTLPEVELEKQLQKHGYTFVTEHNGNLYALQGTFTGDLNAYGEYEQIQINNPYLKLNKKYDINKDGVLIKNDDMMLGLVSLYERSNTLLVENEITMFLNTFNMRINTLISAGDDTTKQSAELYLNKIIDGELGIIGEDRLFDGIKSQSISTGQSNQTTQLIEMNQYIKATLFNEVGLNANFNMKRERLNSSEVDMNTEQLYPLIDNMRLNREKSAMRLSEFFDLDVQVEFGSIWKKKEEVNEVEELDEELVNEIVEEIINADDKDQLTFDDELIEVEEDNDELQSVDIQQTTDVQND